MGKRPPITNRVKELREADAKERAQRKRDMYKALGAASGMDVDAIEKRGIEQRAKEEAEKKKRLEEMFGKTGTSSTSSSKPSEGGAP